MKRFDRTYFDKWYRDPVHKVGTEEDLARQVRFAIAAAEYMLMRPIMNVLDVGAGEGRWQPLISKFRPSARYIGVDPSDYTLNQFGESRNIMRGTFDDLTTLFPEKTFDLVVCCSVLNYLSPPDFKRAIKQLANRTSGVAFIEIFSEEDEVVGDTHQWYTQPARTYRKWMTAAGFTHCGFHTYIVEDYHPATAELEKA